MSSTWKTKAEILQDAAVDAFHVPLVPSCLLRRLLHPTPLPRPLHVVHLLPWPHHVVVVVGPVPFPPSPETPR